MSGKGHPRDRFSHTRKRQRLSGQGVQRIHGHERVEVRPNNYSALPAELSDRSICESPNQSTGGLYQLETRPGSHPHRRLHNWATLRGYAFPPFNMISKTLTKLTIDQTELILVAAVWQAQPWWPVLLRLLIFQPVLLPNSPNLLTDPTDLNHVHPMYPWPSFTSLPAFPS